MNNIESKLLIRRVLILLPEVFGVNAWVRSLADRLAAQGYPALALPLFSLLRLIWSWPMPPVIWLKGAVIRTPPQQIKPWAMPPQRSAGSGPAIPWPALMWRASASGGHVAFRAARCYPGFDFTA